MDKKKSQVASVVRPIVHEPNASRVVAMVVRPKGPIFLSPAHRAGLNMPYPSLRPEGPRETAESAALQAASRSSSIPSPLGWAKGVWPFGPQSAVPKMVFDEARHPINYSTIFDARLYLGFGRRVSAGRVAA